jgi:multiple sugar transport system permease protein
MNRVGFGSIGKWLVILVALIVVLFPFYWMVNTSLKPNSEIFSNPPTFFSRNWSLDAYVTMWQARPIWRYFVNSLIVATGATLLSLLLSSLAAYGFTRFHIRHENLFIILLLFTKMIPGTLLIIPYFQLMANLGLINNYFALIIAYTSFALPFSAWMLIGFFRSIPKELDEAGLIDGCSRLQSFWRVVLPLSLPGLIAVGLFTFLLSWNSYIWALVLTTSPDMFVLPVGIANMVGEYQVQWNQLMAASVLAIMPVVTLYAFLERYLVAGITAGAVKG